MIGQLIFLALQRPLPSQEPQSSGLLSLFGDSGIAIEHYIQNIIIIIILEYLYRIILQ